MDLKEVEEQRKRIDSLDDESEMTLAEAMNRLMLALEAICPTKEDHRQSYKILETPPSIPEGVKKGDILRSAEIYIPGYSWGAKVVETAAMWYGTTEMTITMGLGCASTMCGAPESIEVSSDDCHVFADFGNQKVLCNSRMVEAIQYIMVIALDHHRRQRKIWRDHGQKWLDKDGNVSDK